MNTLKTTLATLLLSTAVATAAAQGQERPLLLKSQVDSLNYAFGYTNGIGMRSYMLKSDSADAEAKMKAFSKGFEETFKSLSPEERIYTEGIQFGAIMSRETEKGYLLNDSLMPFNRKLFEKTLFNCINAKKLSMTQDIAKSYIQEHTRGTAEHSKAKIDSMNTAFAIANGSVIRQYVLRGDTSRKDCKTFRDGYRRGIELYKSHDTIYIEAMRIGAGSYAQLSSSKGIMDNPDLPFDLEIFRSSTLDGLSLSDSALMTAESAELYFISTMQAIEKEKSDRLAAEGEAFLKENAAKDGIITTSSGLQYKVERMGNGALPKATDRVKVHYEGRLIDGTLFDSSYQRGEPLTFALNQVIKGWTEGVQLMPVGSKFTFYVPYTLGYGERGAGNAIPPYATLIFTIELLDIEQ